MHQHVLGCPARSRVDRRVVESSSRPWCSVAVHRSVPKSGRNAHSPQRLQVSCPAVEQDTELPSTSGRAHNDSDLIHVLFQTEQPTLVEMPEVDYAHALNQRVKAAGSVPLLCHLIQQEAPHFDYRSASHALYRLSILCHAYFTQLQSAHLTSREAQQAAWLEYVEPALQTLGQLLIRHIHECDAWAVSISFWAYGNLQCSDEAVFAALCERGLQIMHQFTAQDCACTLVGIAKLRVRPRCQREFVDHLLSHTHELLSVIDAWRTQEVANVLWALSKIGAAGPSRRALLEGLLEMTLWRLQEFRVKELGLIVYSCGRMRLRLPVQLARITNHIAQHLQEVQPLDAAHVLWGCAKVDFNPGPQLLDRLPAMMLDRLGQFKPQEVCNLLYGYGSLQHQHPALLEGVAKACTPRLHEFSTQDLCLTIWSYGMTRYCPTDTALFESACRVLLSRSNSLLPLQLTMTVKGFARCGYQPSPEFMRQIAQLAMQKLHQFSPMEYAQLLWAYAALGYRDVALFESVVWHTMNVLQTWTRRVPKTTVDTIVWSCQRVGFWPQMLIDTAEMRGLYVNTSAQARVADMEPLLPNPQATAGSSSSSSQDDSSSEAVAAAMAAGGAAGSGSSSNVQVGSLLAAVVPSNVAEQPVQQQQHSGASAAAAAAADAVQQPPQHSGFQASAAPTQQQQQQQRFHSLNQHQLWNQPSQQQQQQQQQKRLFTGLQQSHSNGSSQPRAAQQQQQMQQLHGQLQLRRPPSRLHVQQQQQQLPNVRLSLEPLTAAGTPGAVAAGSVAHSSSSSSSPWNGHQPSQPRMGQQQ